MTIYDPDWGYRPWAWMTAFVLAGVVIGFVAGALVVGLVWRTW
jgi:hypothetical protein